MALIGLGYQQEPAYSKQLPRHVADARLIAAAPELLALLTEAAEFIQPFNRAEDLLDRIEATIAKARPEGDAQRTPNQ